MKGNSFFFCRASKMTTAENFAGIDFDEIKEATALEVLKLKMTTNVPKKLYRFTDAKKVTSKLIDGPAFLQQFSF